MTRLAGLLLVPPTLLAVTGGALVAALRPPALAVSERRDWVFRNVTLVEAGRPPRPGRTLQIRSGRIAPSPLPRAAEAPDLAGLYVAPGLIDMHVHYPPKLAVGNIELWSLLLLSHGVTSVRETGSIDGSIFEVRAAIRRGARPGPRIFACGEILDGPDPSFPSNRVVRTASEAREAVRDLAARGADCVKVYNMLSAEALDAIREAAAAVGVPVVGHAPHAVSLEAAGLRDLQHGTGVVRIDREATGRLDFRYEDWRTVDAARIREAARISRAQDIAHTPTLVNARMRELLTTRMGPGGEARLREAIERDSGLRHLPRFWIDLWATLWEAPYRPDDPSRRSAVEHFRGQLAAMTAELHAAGVRIHAGTDTLMPFVAPGSSLHGELADLRRAGIPASEVWAMATRRAGRFLADDGLGTLEPGAPADLIFLSADPRADLAHLARIEAVLSDGRLYRRAELDAGLARFDAHFQGRLYEGVMAVAVRVLKGGFAPGG